MMLIQIQKFVPVSQGLIQLWEDYNFMMWCENVWNGSQMNKEEQRLGSGLNILSEISPQLIQILCAFRILAIIRGEGCGRCLFHIHVGLGLSWETLRAAICPLYRILGTDRAKVRRLLALSSHQTFLGSNTLALRLAKGSLRILNAAINTEQESLFL
jgi:hypothetical protein